MKIYLNQINIPFQVGEGVFINQSLLYWSDNDRRLVPYFSGVIKSIEICINPKSRLVKNETDQTTLEIDLIKYEIQPHSHFNPFGQVQIFDQVETGSKIFPTEQALLQATGKENSVYHSRQDLLNTSVSL